PRRLELVTSENRAAGSRMYDNAVTFDREHGVGAESWRPQRHRAGAYPPSGPPGPRIEHAEDGVEGGRGGFVRPYGFVGDCARQEDGDDIGVGGQHRSGLLALRGP